MAKEYRIAVGSKDGLRSTVWKFCVNKNDIYIISRMFGRESKVSLHATGECQWSLTGDWVKKKPGRTNASRHITKWNIKRPTDSEAQHIFRIHILETELRSTRKIENLKKVTFISPSQKGSAISLECYITPPSTSDPALQTNLPCSVLASIQLADSRWFVVMRNVTTPSIDDVESLRHTILKQIGKQYTPSPEHRIAAFTELPGPTRGFIELCAC